MSTAPDRRVLGFVCGTRFVQAYQPRGNGKYADIVRLFGWEAIDKFYYQARTCWKPPLTQSALQHSILEIRRSPLNVSRSHVLCGYVWATSKGERRTRRNDAHSSL